MNPMKRTATMNRVQYCHTGHIDTTKLIAPVTPPIKPIVGVQVLSQSVNFKRGLLLTSLYTQTAPVTREMKETACHPLFTKGLNKIFEATSNK